MTLRLEAQDRLIKRARVRRYLEEKNLDGIVITRRDNFCWYTSGKLNHVGIATDTGPTKLIVTKNGDYVYASNIEMPRIMAEELSAEEFVPIEFKWWDATDAAEALKKVVGKGVFAADAPENGFTTLGADFNTLRHSLTELEIDRYRWLGAQAAKIAEYVGTVKAEPGMSEIEIAGFVSAACIGAGLANSLILIAADERVYNFRHPIPTAKKIARHLMIVFGAVKWGLTVSLTRLVHFGSLPAELDEKHRAVCGVDAAMIHASRPGTPLAEVFRIGQQKYEQLGHGGEWKLHHQGGTTGYTGRDAKASPAASEVIVDHQALAWNPSIAGTKSEDTIIAYPTHPVIVSGPQNWPKLKVLLQGQTYERSNILVR